jgi:hypothetical protein
MISLQAHASSHWRRVGVERLISESDLLPNLSYGWRWEWRGHSQSDIVCECCQMWQWFLVGRIKFAWVWAWEIFWKMVFYSLGCFGIYIYTVVMLSWLTTWKDDFFRWIWRDMEIYIVWNTYIHACVILFWLTTWKDDFFCCWIWRRYI